MKDETNDMTMKKNKQTASKKEQVNNVTAKLDEKTESERYAKLSMSASTMSAVLSDSFSKPLFPDLKLEDCAIELSNKITSVQDGNMKPIEAMLIGQAQALQMMFVSLGRQAVTKTQLAQYTAFMNLALKAQSQSRATIQALTELKYPKQATFVKQANIAGGNQQVNNSINSAEVTRVKDIENQQSELLEVNNGSKTMDISATSTTSGTDKAMATLAT